MVVLMKAMDCLRIHHKTQWFHGTQFVK